MEKTTILFLALLGLICNTTHAQVSNYSFNAGSAAYTSINGTSPILSGDGANPISDEGYANGIPVGFNFNYLGVEYSNIGASTNGFASFATINGPAFSNHLSYGGPRLILAPLWEDLALPATTNLQYLTSGSSGTRVFILQWTNALYDFGAGASSISFQLRLYETTNTIEFIYSQLPGVVQDFSGGASIGITSSATGAGSFLSLNNSGSLPVASSTNAIDNIVSRPATGQLYSFSPPACASPVNLSVSSITSNSAVVNWAGSATSFEYALTTDIVPPVNGTSTTSGSITINALLPSTSYFLHVRQDCAGAFSGWSTTSFTCLPVNNSPPYSMPISTVTAPSLPAGCTIADANNDNNSWRSFPSGGNGWTDQVMAYVFNINGTTPANDWLFTRAVELVAGSSYRLKFKYNNDGSMLYTEKLKVAFGILPAAGAMSFLLTDLNSISSVTPKNASIDFIATTSDTYYIGFHAYSDANKNVLILDDISLTATPSCDLPRNLAVSLVAAGNAVNVNLSWLAPVTGVPSGYEYAVTSDIQPPATGIATTTRNGSVSALVANSQYYLHVRTKCGVSFSEWATIPFATIVNDIPCNAISLTAGGVTYCGNTKLATSNSDPYSDCSTADHSVWFKYTATVSGTIVLQISTPAAPADPLRGWVNWYLRSGSCPEPSFNAIGDCKEFGNQGNSQMSYLLSPLLDAGTTYYIMIDGYSDDTGEFCINIPACAPALDVKVENIISTSASVSWTGTGSFMIEYGLAGFTPGQGIIAGAGGVIVNPAISPHVISDLTLSTIYDVYVRQSCITAGNGYSSNSIKTSFSTLGLPPLNDNCGGATDLTVHDLSCGGPVSGSTLNATPSGVTPLPTCSGSSTGYDDDVWFKFTPVPGQMLVDIVFADSVLKHAVGKMANSGDIVAQIYTSSDNTCAGQFTPFACSDDEGSGSLPGFYALDVVPGTTYYIRIFTYGSGIFEDFTICVYKTLLQNDDAASASPIIVNAVCNGAMFTNSGATVSPGEPAGSCSSLTPHATVWYKFNAPSGGAVRISTALGTGNSLMNSRVALFSASDVFDYGSFNIIACDEDGGSGQFDQMSVIYATGLISGTTYYIQVDKFDANTAEGTFCLTVERINPSMLSPNNCSGIYQPVVGAIPGYKGWVSLLDDSSRLVAQVRNTAGGAANAYSAMQNINTGALRKDSVSGEYYLNRNVKITNNLLNNASVTVQLFFTNAELAALTAIDSAATLARLRVTRQTSADCQPDFIASNGVNSELVQLANTGETVNGVSWIRFNTTGFSNFYIHSTRSFLTGKTFLQGAYSSTAIRHRDVTSSWAAVLNTYARNQPYSGAPFNYTGKEAVPPGFFTATSATTDIVDWVLVEIKTNSGSVVTRRAAFIREDGIIVDLDGVTPVSLYGASSGSYNIFVRHRNHLGIRSGSTQTFTNSSMGIAPVTSSYDFTTAQNKAYQNGALSSNPAMKDFSGKFSMWGGNGNSNNQSRASGGSFTVNDFLHLTNSALAGNSSLILGVPATGGIYHPADMNLDGVVRASGGSAAINDFLFLVNNILAGNISVIYSEHL